jgi:ubiquinone/menaquinone biosynthesis C-methylase UbiE
MSKRQFDDFDGFANGYRALHTENIKLSGADSFYFAENKVLTLKEYELNNELSMLDVGCGDGAVEIFIKQHFSNWRVDGIDISEKSLVQARQRNLNNTKFGLYNGIQIPFQDNSFDIVFVAAVLHHIDFKLHQQFIEEVHRVLKKGGRVYVFEHNPLNPATRYLVSTCVFDKDARLLSYSYTKRLLSAFESAQKKFILFFPRQGILSAFIKFEKKLSWLPLGAQYYFRAVK